MARIREAGHDDAEGIARVQVDSWQSAYPGLVPDTVLVSMSPKRQSDQWARAIDHPRVRHAVLVATVAGGVVGFGSCGPARDPSLGYGGEVYTLYVHPDHQDRGLGRALLRGLFDRLLARAMDSAMVWVLADNPSRFFYETMGGTRVAERDENMWGTVLGEAAYGWSDLRVTRAGRRAGGGPA